MNVNVISRLNAAIRWRCAVNCRRVHASVILKSQELGDDGLPKDYKIRTLKAGSRRLDTFVNRASGKSSAQVEKLILGGRVRVNDDVHTKKSYNSGYSLPFTHDSFAGRVAFLCHTDHYEPNQQPLVQKQDCVEVWIGPYPENNNLAEVERYEVTNYDVTESGYDIHVKSWKKFLVENWRGT